MASIPTVDDMELAVPEEPAKLEEEPICHEQQQQEVQEVHEQQVHEEPPNQEVTTTDNLPPALEQIIPQESSHHHDSQILRRGKWTPQESAYAVRLIHEFRLGTLPLPPAITLREFLSKTLRCDPMRITKKFEGDNSLRKVVYKRLADGEAVREARSAVKILEDEFLDRLDKTKSTSSQAVADRALLDALRESGARDLIELFCLGVQRQQESQLREDKSLLLGDSNVVDGASSLKRHHEMEHADGGGGVTSYRRELLLHLSRMQQLIQGRSIELGTASIDDKVDSMPPMKKFKSEETSCLVDDQPTVESNYNTAISNLLSIQRMIMDNKHKLYDIEFNLAEVQLTSGESSLEIDTERRAEAMASIKKEIEMLELQKQEIEMEIETKYKTAVKTQGEGVVEEQEQRV